MWEIVLAIATVIVFCRIYEWFNNYKRKRVPLARGLPFLGNIFQVSTNGLPMGLSEIAKKYGDIFRINLFGSEIVVVNSPALIHEACIERGDDFASRSTAPYVLRTITYNARDLAFSPTNKSWSLLRKAFYASLKTYGEANIDIQEIIHSELEELVQKFDQQCGSPMSPQPDIRRVLTNIITSLLIGRKVEKNSVEAETIERMINSMVLCMTPGFGAELDLLPFLRWLPIKSSKILRRAKESRDALLNPVFRDAKATFDPACVRGFLDMLIKVQLNDVEKSGQPQISDKHILGSMMDLFLGGVFTTYSVVSSLILVCLHYPSVQVNLQEEVDRVIGRSQMPNLHHRADMHYLNATVLEILRFVSVAAFLPRSTIRDTTLGGYDIPKNAKVILNIWEANHGRTWEHPWVFRPERFLDAEGKLLDASDRRRKGFLPFGAGPRSCVGEVFAKNRVFLFVATLWQKFSFLPVQGHVTPSCDPRTFEVKLGVTPKPFCCLITRRE